MLNSMLQRKNSKFAIIFFGIRKHIYVVFSFVFHFMTRAFLHNRGKNKVAWIEKRKKLREFSYSKNLTNFETFLWSIQLSINLLFLKYSRANTHLQNSLILSIISKFLQSSGNFFYGLRVFLKIRLGFYCHFLLGTNRAFHCWS